MLPYRILFPIYFGLIAASSFVHADLSGFATLQSQTYFEDPAYNQQLDYDISLSITRKYTTSWNKDQDQFTIEGFGRMGSQDDEKNHFDLHELYWLHLDEDYEWRLGSNIVFWGVTESKNLVDVINQKDSVEGTDNSKKLGQPMLQFSAIKDWGTFDSFILFGFRERSFAGEKGRPRFPLVVDTDVVSFEASNDKNHIDLAFRYTHYIEDIDYSVSLFKGTSRDPVLSPAIIDSKNVFSVHYPQMTQIGLEVQTIVEAWLWKAEAIYRDHKKQDDYAALTAGFEYSFYGISDSAIDLGTIIEYLYDDRGSSATTALNNDLFFGARFTFNDIQSTSILAGMIYDTKNNTSIMRVEAERRMGDVFKISAEMFLYGDIDNSDPFSAFEKDNAFQLELAYYF